MNKLLKSKAFWIPFVLFLVLFYLYGSLGGIPISCDCGFCPQTIGSEVNPELEECLARQDECMASCSREEIRLGLEFVLIGLIPALIISSLIYLAFKKLASRRRA